MYIICPNTWMYKRQLINFKNIEMLRLRRAYFVNGGLLGPPTKFTTLSPHTVIL
jgi:hypothetical protein